MAKTYKYTAKRSHSSPFKAHADSNHVSSTASVAPPSQMKFENIQRQTSEEENVQMKHVPFQFKQEEEEKLQMKTAPFQLQQEEEEQIQTEVTPFQLQEEEEEAQLQTGTTALQEEEEENIQMKAALGAPQHIQGCGCSACAGGAEAAVQQKKKTEQHLDDNEETTTNASEGTKTKMPQGMQMKMETALGSDFSNVNIHVNSEKASQIGALAYTQGSDIHFAKGQYAPESSRGQELLGHELTHIVQQREGKVQPTTEVKGMPVNDSHSLEQEADVMGRKAAQTEVNQTKPTTQRKKERSSKGGVVQGGFFKKLWKGVKKVGSAIGGAAKKTWKGIKKAGRWLGGAAKKVWNGVKWVGKQLWSKTKGIFQRAWRWITNLPSRLKRLFGHLWKGVKSLKPWSLKWWKSLGKASTWKNFGKWLGEFAIYGLEVLGLPEIYETLSDFIKFNTRELTAAEKEKARKVFGNAIDYGLVRVDSRALLGPSWTGRAYVSFHTINAWGPLNDHTLIHELTHVWQYENKGAMYMPRAIHAQGTVEGYNYTFAALQANGGNLDAFNYEQQGQILGDYYVMLTQDSSNPRLAVYQQYADYARRR